MKIYFDRWTQPRHISPLKIREVSTNG